MNITFRYAYKSGEKCLRILSYIYDLVCYPEGKELI